MEFNIVLVVLATLILQQSAADPSFTCGAPQQAPHTEPVVLTENAKVGDVIQQECTDGYGPEYTTFCECLGTGEWDDQCNSSVLCKVNPDPPGNFKVGPYSATNWVSLTWSHPKKIDDITGYEVRCNNYTKWKRVSNRYTAYNYQHGIRPHMLVSCEIRSVKGPFIKSSIITSGFYRTGCAAPSPPLNLEFGTPIFVSSSGKRIWKYTVTWQPPQYANCEGLSSSHPYDINYPRSSSPKRTARTNSAVVYAGGDEQITFTVWARSSNSSLPLSQPVSRTIRTPEIIDDLLIRRLVFEASYNMECSRLENSATRQAMTSTAKQNYLHIRELCKNLCAVSEMSNPSTSCTNNILVITWPTESVYRANITSIPANVKAQVAVRLIQKGNFLPIVLLTAMPPIVYPVANSDGSSATIRLKLQCITGYSYNVGKDICESV